MLAATENTAPNAWRLAARMAQGGSYPPPGGYRPPGPGGLGPPPGPGGYGPPGNGGGWGPAGPGGYGPPGPPYPPAKPITGSPDTMAMHAMTIDPRTGLPRGEKPPASIPAVVALVCGILICLGPFTAIPAIIAGVLARKAAREQPQTVGGNRMGTAGLILGGVNLLLWFVGGAIWIFQALNS